MMQKVIDSVEAKSVAGEKISVIGLAKEFNEPVKKIRESLESHYGVRVSFRRGRTGGVVITPDATN